MTGFPATGLTKFLHAVHQVTGDMARSFGPALTPEKLDEWARALRAVAEEMEVAAGEMARRSAKKKRWK